MESLLEGMITEVTIDRVTDYGYYVRYCDSLGLLSLLEISWDSRLKSEALLKLYKPNDALVVKVRHCTPELFYCSAKEAVPSENPWLPDGVLQTGAQTTGTVTMITEYGWFLDLALPASALLRKQGKDEVWDPGALLNVTISKVDREREQLEVELSV